MSQDKRTIKKLKLGALTCRSFYSMLRGVVSVEDLVRAAKENGYSAVAMADVNAMHGAVDLAKAAEKEGIRAITGAEILTDDVRAVLLAENEAGYSNICTITSARNLAEHFDLFEQLNMHNEGVICISYCPQQWAKCAEVLPAGSFYAGCDDICKIEYAIKLGCNPVAAGNFNILDDSDIVIGRLVERIRSLSVAGAGPADRVGFNKLIPEKKFREQYKNFSQAIENNIDIVNRCNFELLNGRLHLPQTHRAKGADADRELSRLSHLGLAKRYPKLTKDLIKRLEYELSVISRNGFSDYFLVVRDIIDFARRNGIPVDVRGSAAGSLVSYVLGFTRVCPIENKLYFERFMNPGRKDCPDIDIDLCWRGRDRIIEYCYQNWGSDYVAMICTISRYRRRSAIRDVGRAFGLVPHQINELVNNPQKTTSPIYRLADRITGMPRHVGLHCGGLVITPQPVSQLAPLQYATKGVVVTQYDKDAAEAVGLVKMDLLGNRSLSTVAGTVSLLAEQGTEVDIDAVDTADELTSQMLTRGEALGVFQCESPGMRQLLRALTIHDWHDVAIALSLIRPGPAAGGMKEEYIQRHVYKKQFKYIHPRIKEVLGDTYGVMLYQEDIMKMAVEVAGMTVTQADRLRSEVSKRVSSKRLHDQYKMFVYGQAEKAGMDRDTAEQIWDQILRFAQYSYCRAHATVYANIAWQCAWLKAHYPHQFYTSLLNNHHGMYPLRVYVWDAMRHGIRVKPPHVNSSGIEWSMQSRSIRAALRIIKGLSYSSMQQIVARANESLFDSLDDLRRRVNLTKPELRSLIHVGACDGLGFSRPAMLMQLRFAPLSAGQGVLFDPFAVPGIKQLPDYDRLARLKAEVDVTGIPFSVHPAVLLMRKHINARDLEKFVDREVTVAGFVATGRSARTSDGKTMGFVTLEDATGLAEVSFFPDKFDQYRRLTRTAGPIWIRGRVVRHMSSITIECANSGRAA